MLKTPGEQEQKFHYCLDPGQLYCQAAFKMGENGCYKEESILYLGGLRVRICVDAVASSVTRLVN